MNRWQLGILSFFFLIFGFTVGSSAKIRLPAFIGDHMVLQQQEEVNVWGWSDPAEKIYITTSWDNKTDSTRANGDAKWKTTVRTPTAGGPYTITIKGSSPNSETNTIILRDILIGEVWICSGQSNMGMNMSYAIPQMEAAVAHGQNSQIRLLPMAKTTALTPQEDVSGEWVEAGPETLKGFSAVAYFFGKELYEKLRIPIGLIHSSWGGTPAEVWTPKESVERSRVLENAAEKIDQVNWWPNKPGRTYNAMIAPLTPFNIAGAIWYQGESNVNTADSYARLMKTLITDWRQMWNDDFPFYFVQIAPYTYGNKNVGALLREAQTNTLSLANTGMVVITDLVDDIKDIHPHNKWDVGQRLARMALGAHYKKPGLTYESPQYMGKSISGNTIIISFDHASDGLIAKGGNGSEEWFIAGEDKVFYPAEIKIRGNQVRVSSKEVKNPVAVRFGFSNAGIGHVFNRAGLPINPFRTDHWVVDISSVKEE